MNSWNSPGKIYNLGHAAIQDLLLDPVLIEEKVDGSYFQFGVINGELRCRSKGAELHVSAPEKLFERAVNTAIALKDKLNPDWSYRGEYLAKPKHNVLCYDRVPNQHIVIHDICVGEEMYLVYDDKKREADRLGLECVPVLGDQKLENIAEIREFLRKESFLGGQKIEGVVVKNYSRFCKDGKAMMGKFVSEAFKEVHGSEWKQENPGHGDVLAILVNNYRTSARWAKAVQHLKEAGKLTNSPKDIGLLIKEAQKDIEEECAEEIKEKLYKWAAPQILRRTTAGLPEWWKEELMKLQFEKGEKDESAS